MAAVFGTPVAATLFGVELLAFEWKPRTMVPVAVSAATAMVIRDILTLPPAEPLAGLAGRLADDVAARRQRLFPVIGDGGTLLGILTRPTWPPTPPRPSPRLPATTAAPSRRARPSTSPAPA
ncbi:MAG: chloride channel protein, partial [Streptosporangiaceae bacterium]